MKVISVRQPWAWCIFHGKDIENRDSAWPWNTYRGPVLIHASKGCGKQEFADAVDWIHHVIGPDFYIPPLEQMPLGMIEGKAFLERVVERSDSPWFQGKYGLVLLDRKELSIPVPAKGMLGFWEFEDPALSAASISGGFMDYSQKEATK